MDKIALIRALATTGRAADLRELLLGISSYCVPSTEQAAWGSDGERLRQMAEVHLEFIAKHGTNVVQVQEGKFRRIAYPREFEQWLEAGAPGIEEADIHAYLAENPLK